VIGVTCVNLLAGVGIGVAVSVFFAIRRLSSVTFEKRQEGDVWKVAIRGTLTFACVPKLNHELSSLPAGSAVDIDLDVDFIDHAAFESVHGWRLNHEKTGGKVCVEERQEEWYKPASEGRPRCSRGA
jgi:carbonic anhydrase